MTAIGENISTQTEFTTDLSDLSRPYNGHGERRLTFGPAAVAEPVDQAAFDLLAANIFPADENQLVVVYSAVAAKHLGAIATDGLLVKKNSVLRYGSPAHESTFFEARPRHLAGFDRTRSIYASPFAPHRHDIANARGNTAHGKQIYLDLLVDPDEVIVTDQAVWDKAHATYGNLGSGYAMQTVIQRYAREYWDIAVKLSDFTLDVADSYLNPEVIIPFDVPASRLRLHATQIDS